MSQLPIQQSPLDPAELGAILLRTGISLLKAGAGSSRVVLTVTRFARAYGHEVHVNVGTRSVSLSLHDDKGAQVFSGARSMDALPGVNFRVIDGISRLGWALTDNPVPLQEAASMLEQVADMPHYSRWMVLGMVGLAGAAFCYTFGGDRLEMITAFVASIAGLFFKQEAVRKKFNPYLVTYGSAVVAALAVALVWKTGVGDRFEHALSTCILFLIPGVPLIHSVIDLMDGYTANGIERGVNATMHAFAIAAGLATVLYIFQLYR